MPTCHRKRVALVDPSPHLLSATGPAAEREVYYLAQTGEIFETFDQYNARMDYYRVKQFQCEVTGKSNLTYFEALESEMHEATTMHARFPEPLKASILSAVQWQVMGRLDHLVDAVYERFKDRYFPEERVVVDVSGQKYFARIVHVFPPRPRPDSTNGASSSSNPPPLPPLHSVGGDLKTPLKEAVERDDPLKYHYQIQIIDEERSSDNKLSAKDREAREANRAKWSASLMEVKCGVLSRDRLAFSKSILRRFIRDCVDRDAALASPWIVKSAIAERYGVSTAMPESIRQSVENIKKGELEKRKKVWEEKEGPPSKKQKKLQEAREAALTAAAEVREREQNKKKEEEEEEAARLAAEEKKKQKKKPLRYPTEDLDVRIPDKDIKAGANIQRPLAKKDTLPFGEDQKLFETFIMTWNFFMAYGHPLHLSTFTLDEYEHALRHSVEEPACGLIAEIHSTLIYNLRTVTYNRHSALLSLSKQKDDWDMASDLSASEGGGQGTVLGVTIDGLTTAMTDVGNNWERTALRHSEGREGWQDALLGCLKDHADTDRFPRLRIVLTRLLFAPDSTNASESASVASGATSPPPSTLSVQATPRDRYHTLPVEDKLAIIAFLCDTAITSKTMHAYLEQSEEQLTTLRKEKIELGRTKKQLTEDLNTLLGINKPEEKTKDETAERDSSELSELASDAENDSEAPAASRPKSVRRPGASAKERQAARAKIASEKQAQAEQRRLEDELARIERRLEAIEREFRKLFGVTRTRPLGKDRFHNRYWWFDGLGSASLVGSGNVSLYGTGRVFIQGPSEFDVEVLEKREREERDVVSRRAEEEGPGQLKVGEWAVYEDIEEVNELIAWLNPKGIREVALKNAFQKWMLHLSGGMRRRASDLEVQAKIPDARRSERMRNIPGADIARQPYMLWQNKRALQSA